MKNNIEWLWHHLILRGHVSILGSRGGVGKSSFALWIAHELAKEGKTTLYIDAEKTGGTHGERANNWNLTYADRIIFLCEDIGEDIGKSSIEPTGTKSNEELLAAAIDIKPDLIIIDSMTFAASHIKAKEREEAVNYLKGLKIIAAKMRCGLLLLTHTNKKQDPGEQLTLDSIYGSGGITDAARSVFVIDYFDKDNNPTERILMHSKSNYSALSSDMLFDLDKNGITNFREKSASTRKSGIKSEHLQNLVKEWYTEGLTLKEIQTRLIIESDGTPNERSRAIKKITKDLNITWR